LRERAQEIGVRIGLTQNFAKTALQACFIRAERKMLFRMRRDSLPVGTGERIAHIENHGGDAL
jgi:hypothetical protein